MMKFGHIRAIALLSAIAIAAPVAASEQNETERVDRTVSIRAGGQLRLKNFSGRVTVTGSNRSDMAVHAVRRAPRESWKSARVMERRRSGRAEDKRSRGPRFPSGRIEDWTAFAVASALTGREADARNAWFASMALASDLQHQCNNAVRAEAIYGERLRSSVQAMLQRARSSAAYGRCEAALSVQPSHAKRSGATATKPSSKAPARSAAKPAQSSRRPSA